MADDEQRDNDPAGRSAKPRTRFFRFRNRLKEKALGGGGGGPPSFNLEALKKAEAEFEKLAEEYPDWVQDSLTSLSEEWAGATSCSPKERAPQFSKINDLAHEMRGQGGTFGYPLISAFGKSLYSFTGPDAGRSDNHMEIVKAHIDAMKAVIGGRVEGDGGEIGQQLEKALDAAIKKYSPEGGKT